MCPISLILEGSECAAECESESVANLTDVSFASLVELGFGA